jgi:hypothetical protein
VKVRVAALIAVVAALCLSAHNAWRNRDMPRLGYLHDDGLYLVSAKSLAAGEGYRIASLPGKPYQTKYPPLYPWLLAHVWTIFPAFPANLTAFAVFSWAAVPVLALMTYVLLVRIGLDRFHAWCATVLVVLSPYVAVFSNVLLSELPFTILLLTSVLCAERGGWRWACLAGAFAGLAFLTRSAALPLLFSTPAVYLLRARRREAMTFAVSMLPAIAGWGFWLRAHKSDGADLLLTYYTNYAGFYLATLDWAGVPAMFWQNLGVLLTSAGRLVLFDINESVLHRVLLQTLGAGCIAGAVRLSRTGGLSHYAAYAACSLPMLLLWNFSPNERFLLPYLPLLLAGFLFELTHVRRTTAIAAKSSQASQRAAAMAVALVLLLLCGTCAYVLVNAWTNYLPAAFANWRDSTAANRGAYEWVVTHTPESATFLSARDPVFYLYTDRTATVPHVPHERYGGESPHDPSSADFLRRRGASYVLYAPFEYDYMPEAQRQSLQQSVHEESRLEPVYKGAGGVTVFKLR